MTDKEAGESKKRQHIYSKCQGKGS